ncbi:HIT domain-containing protein [Xanthomonas sp. 3058]|uniref:HIT family protein n=1 Tax=Xanthomonas sp. 3058 TaxID=3035314 RepID=UPI001856D021|nr:HIT domain-containing protein [Xanthomonas sp. 3058]MBB5863132.1 histidine triad (HIT) family protein [Xanthomonas sp. 3058]
MIDTCVFYAIVAGTAPASVVWEDVQVVAFVDLRQPVPGHVLVVPRVHAPQLHDLDEDSAAQLMRVAHRVVCAMQQCWAPAGSNLWQSNGVAGGQEVPHVHLHVQPRRDGDGLLRFYPEGVPLPASRDLLDALATQLRGVLEPGRE